MVAKEIDAPAVERGVRPYLASPDLDAPAVAVADLEILPGTRQVFADGSWVQLTQRELELLLLFARQPDRVITRYAIFQQVWGGKMAYRDRSVDVYVRRVRLKLRKLSPEMAYIHTHFGIGYRFCGEALTAADENGDGWR